MYDEFDPDERKDSVERFADPGGNSVLHAGEGVRRQGVCGDCGRTFAVCRDGTLPPHRHRGLACVGSRELPHFLLVPKESKK